MFEGNPFYLDAAAEQWVEDTFASMTKEEKIGQLLCPSMVRYSCQQAQKLIEVNKVGAVLMRPQPLEGLRENIRFMQSLSDIPLLISANLESGSNGAFKGGTNYANPMGCGATGEEESGYRLGRIACGEAGAVGINWSYAPLVDIDMSYRNPITNIRSFGADADMVLRMARGYLRGAEGTGVVPTIKHFPGDGTDERDQHIVVSVNKLDADEWMESYGKVYKTLIAEGAKSVMVGHIAQPAVARSLCPDISTYDAYMPASLSPVLTRKLLREELGFNGLAVTDSSLMMGFMQKMPRRQAVPTAIESGVDIILFSRNVEEDIRFIREGLEGGILSVERFTEAVKRVLAFKASEKMHIKKADGTLVPDRDVFALTDKPTTEKWVRECADKAVTLIKNNDDLLPLSVNKNKRIYLNVIERTMKNNTSFALDIKNRFEKEGFEVTLRRRDVDFSVDKLLSDEQTPELEALRQEIFDDTEHFVSKYDMGVIVVKLPAASNITTVRVNWKVMLGVGNDFPWYAGEMPLLCVSVANPYHLLDIPMADAYINTYSYNKATLDALFDKIMGRSEFKGISPVDASCGMEDTML